METLLGVILGLVACIYIIQLNHDSMLRRIEKRLDEMSSAREHY